jgi:hypothetical protein
MLNRDPSVQLQTELGNDLSVRYEFKENIESELDITTIGATGAATDSISDTEGGGEDGACFECSGGEFCKFVPSHAQKQFSFLWNGKRSRVNCRREVDHPVPNSASSLKAADDAKEEEQGGDVADANLLVGGEQQGTFDFEIPSPTPTISPLAHPSPQRAAGGVLPAKGPRGRLFEEGVAAAPASSEPSPLPAQLPAPPAPPVPPATAAPTPAATTTPPPLQPFPRLPPTSPSISDEQRQVTADEGLLLYQQAASSSTMEKYAVQSALVRLGVAYGSRDDPSALRALVRHATAQYANYTATSRSRKRKSSSS